MKILILSNAPWVTSGYGAQTKIVAPRLKALGHSIAVHGYFGHQGAPIDWNGGIQIYGSVAQPFGQDIMAAHATNFHADIILSNMDAWVIEPELMFEHKWVAWFPIDSEPCPPLVIQKVRQAFHRIVWTDFARKEMDAVGLDYDYIPYGVDTEVYKPGDKTQARETAHMPLDKFIVGQIAMNKGYPPRKAFYQNIMAFKAFHERHPDSFLYLHTLDGTKPNGETIDLDSYCIGLGLKVGEDVVFADQYSYSIGYPDNAMNILYNCMDVHLLVSMGEGFGMPQLEAQACGVPVICGDWTTMPELCFSGWKVLKSEAEPSFTLQNAYQYTPHVDAIADRLEQAYRMRGNVDYSKRARDGAMAYNIDKVVSKYWIPTLEHIELKLKDAPKTDVLSQNLAVLR